MATASSPWCLVLEDQALIGMALEASLEEAGFRVAGPFMSNSETLDWLEDNAPDLALVDILLKDGPCTPVLRVLQNRKIPFAIYSGLRPSTLPPELAAVRWLEKPISRGDLKKALLDITPKPPLEEEAADSLATA
jgi:DNA-binding response OmpR family regulator